MRIITCLLIIIIITACSSVGNNEIKSNLNPTVDEQRNKINTDFTINDSFFDENDRTTNHEKMVIDSNGSELPELEVAQPLITTRGLELITPIVEWHAGMKTENAELPLLFGDQSATLKIGWNNPNGMRFAVYFEGENFIINLELTEENSETLDNVENGKGRIQATTVDLDGDGTREIIISSFDEIVDGHVWIFSYTEVANKKKVNPFRQEFTEYTQGEVVIDGSHIYIPYGSQGLFEEYLYTAEGIFKRYYQ